MTKQHSCCYLINDKYLWIDINEILPILGPEEKDFFINGCRIPYEGGGDLWPLKSVIDNKIEKAVLAGKIKTHTQELSYSKAKFSIISDDLGIKGVVNPVNGKPYDSKSEYYKTVKRAGMEVVGTDAKAETRKEITGDFDCRKDIAQAIEQTGAMDKLKRKKK